MSDPRKNRIARKRRRRSNERWLARRDHHAHKETFLERYLRDCDIVQDVMLAARVVDRRFPGVLDLTLKGLGVL